MVRLLLCTSSATSGLAVLSKVLSGCTLAEVGGITLSQKGVPQLPERVLPWLNVCGSRAFEGEQEKQASASPSWAVADFLQQSNNGTGRLGFP